MNPATPAQLALELGVSSHDVREVLRDAYGTLREQQTPIQRWRLDEQQANLVREHFRNNHRNPLVWSLEPGETVRRRELQDTYGGSRQDGIVTSSVTTDIIVFTDPVKGARYGYDRFDGLHPDGTYTYTGAGHTGEQQFARGNKALRDAAADGRTIRLFVSQGVNVTYEGAFTTGDPTYTYQQIPDIEGNLRRGIVFNFVPLGERGSDLPLNAGPETSSELLLTDWNPPNDSDVPVPAPDDDSIVQDHVITRVEHNLQAAFGAWLRINGLTPQTLKLPTSAGLIEPDLYVAQQRWIVEAKKSTARSYVRMAIGQVLDYTHLAKKHGIDATPVILLPGRPEPDLYDLIRSLNITVAVRTDTGFDITPPPRTAEATRPRSAAQPRSPHLKPHRQNTTRNNGYSR